MWILFSLWYLSVTLGLSGFFVVTGDDLTEEKSPKYWAVFLVSFFWPLVLPVFSVLFLMDWLDSRNKKQ